MSYAAQPVGFVDAVTTCLRKYVDFSGRANRSEFWFFVLFVSIIGFVLGVIGSNALAAIINLALLLPYFAVGARRLHDIGKSGWIQILPLVPLAYLFLA